ncbi:MAG: hypothetical protein LBC83_03400 [Oscillospiraceae bacterium]|jgi:hypothetical protein|nr:hypothetical protein [Oscillospiraceae bacterium]
MKQDIRQTKFLKRAFSTLLASLVLFVGLPQAGRVFADAPLDVTKDNFLALSGAGDDYAAARMLAALIADNWNVSNGSWSGATNDDNAYDNFVFSNGTDNNVPKILATLGLSGYQDMTGLTNGSGGVIGTTVATNKNSSDYGTSQNSIGWISGNGNNVSSTNQNHYAEAVRAAGARQNFAGTGNWPNWPDFPNENQLGTSGINNTLSKSGPTYTRAAKTALMQEYDPNLGDMPDEVATSGYIATTHTMQWTAMGHMRASGESGSLVKYNRWRMSTSYRFGWHTLSAISFETSNTDVTSAKAALQAWDALDWNVTDATVYDYTADELTVWMAAYDAADDLMTTETVDSAYLSAAGNADLLAFYGLQAYDYGTDLREKVENVRDAKLAFLNAEYFHKENAGVLVTDPTQLFNTAITQDDFDPRTGYTALELTALEAYYIEASVKHNFLISTRDNKPAVWAEVEDLCAAADPAITLDLDAQAEWLANLQLTIRLWKIWDKFEFVQEYLSRSANYHEGANPDDVGNSDFTHDYQQIQTWYEFSVGDVDFLSQMRADGYSDQVEAIFDTVEQTLTERRNALGIELDYRDANGFGEETWYSYRDYFGHYEAVDFTGMTNEQILALLNDVTAHVNAPKPPYNGLKANAQAYRTASTAGETALGAELWGEIYGTYDARVITPLLENAYQVMATRVTLQIEDAMAIVHAAETANEIELPVEGIKVLSWATFIKLKDAIDKLDRVTYNGLAADAKLDLLGDSAAGYSAADAQNDYALLIGPITQAYNDFVANPGAYFKQTDIGTMQRDPMAEDILPGHSYEVDDATLLEIIGKLDAMLGRDGDLKPILQAIDPAGTLLDLSSFGIDINAVDTLNVGTILDAALSGMVFNDATVNMLIGMFYESVLPEFEKQFGALADVSIGDPVKRVDFYSLHSILAAGGGMSGLKLYPDLWKNNITSFPEVKAMVEQYAITSRDWEAYPTNAWGDLPHDGDGNLTLPWGIDQLPVEQREARFKQALYESLKGLLPLLRSLFFNQTVDMNNNYAAHIWAEQVIIITIPIEADAIVNMRLAPNAGYGKVLVPIFEQLLGTDTSTVLNNAQCQSVNTIEGAVDAIFNPVFALLDNIKEKPITEILNLLPNLMVGVSFDRVVPLLQNLIVNLSYSVTTDNAIVNLFAGSVLDALASAVDPINIADMLLSGDSPVDLSFLGDVNKLIETIIPGLGLPPFNPGRVATYGQMHTSAETEYATKRMDGKTRFYIESDKADMAKALLLYLKNSGLLGSLGLDSSASSDGAFVAAIAELFKPGDYPNVKPIYGQPDLGDNPYPTWWKSLEPGEVEADAQFLVDNAEDILNLVWEILSGNQGETLGQGIGHILDDGVFTLASYQALTGEIKSLLGSQALVDLLAQYGVLLDGILLPDGTIYSLQAALSTMLNDSTEPAITDIDSFLDAIAAYFAPIGPLLDFILADKDLGLFPASDGAPLLTAKGYDGYEKAIIPILKAFTAPLGLNGEIISHAAFKALGTSEARIKALLNPIAKVYAALLANPVAVLDLLPNLAYFMTPPATGGESPMQQSLHALAHPLYVLVDTLRPITDLLGVISTDGLPDWLQIDRSNGILLDLETLLDSVLNEQLSPLLNNAGLPASFDISQLVLGTLNPAGYLEADRAAVLFALMKEAGLLDAIESSGWAGVVNLIRGAEPPAPSDIDYSQAPGAVTVTPPSWLGENAMPYLVENADDLINWLWQNIILANTETKDWLQGLLGDVVVGNTLEATVQNLWGSDYYVKSNFTKLVQQIADLKPQLTAITFPNPMGGADLRLYDLLERLVSVSGTPLNMDDVFAPFEAYLADPGAVTITNEAEFKTALTDLLLPAMPLIRVLLAGEDVKLVPEIDSGNGLITIFGSDGYENGLLPLLRGLGAGIVGYDAQLVPAADFAAGTEAEQIAAIIDPILHLINTLASKPVDTVLQMVPNLAYLISDANGTSIIQQAMDRLLHPVTVLLPNVPELEAMYNAAVPQLKLGDKLNALLATELPKLETGGLQIKGLTIEDLIVGTITKFDAADADDPTAPAYVAVDRALLLTQLLDKFGVFGLLEEQNLTGLLSLLDESNYAPLAPISYPDADIAARLKNYYKKCWWTPKKADKLANDAPKYLDMIWKVLYGKEFGAIDENGKTAGENYLHDMLGDSLYTKENLLLVLGMIQGQLPEIADSEILPGWTLSDLVGKIVTIGGESVDALAMLNHLRTWQPTGTINSEATFIAALKDYLRPAMPLLDFVLAGKNITILGDVPNATLQVSGYEGYRYGLIPIYEALLLPLDLQAAVVAPGTYIGATADEKVDALIAPVLTALAATLENPTTNLFKLIPNLSYFTSEIDGRPSLLQQSLDRTLFAVNRLINAYTGQTGSLITIDAQAMLGSLLGGLQIPGLDAAIFSKLMVGTLKTVYSASGSTAKYVAVTDRDRADLITIIIGEFATVMKNKSQRNALIDILGDGAGLSGFTKGFIKFLLNATYDIAKLPTHGTPYLIWKFKETLKFMEWMINLLTFLKVL